MDASIKKKQSPNPRPSANIISLITFGWVIELLNKGYKKDLEIEDLYEALDEHQSSFLGGKLERLWNNELKQTQISGKEPSLFKVMCRCFGPYAIFLQFVIASVELCFVLTQPLFLGQLIRYFSPGSKVSYEEALRSAGCIIACSALTIFIGHAHNMGVFHTGMKMRIGLCSLIYRKALRLSKTALGETTVGQAVNLLSNDVNRFDVLLLFLPYIWIGPVESIIAVYLMWQQIGIATFAGVATVVIVIPLQVVCGKMISNLRLRTAKRTDQRIRLMNEIIVGIQVIKMYAWEKPFAHLVSLARKSEIKVVKTSSFVKAFMLCFGWLIGRKTAIFVSIVTYVLMGGDITPEKMFVVAAYFNILTESMTVCVSFAIAHFAEAYTSVRRVQKFLLYNEVYVGDKMTLRNEGEDNINTEAGKDKPDFVMSNDVKVDPAKTEESSDIIGDLCVTNITAKWSEDVIENTLTGVNFEVRSGSLVAIVGPVGSGKTSLLHAILKELPLISGVISVKGSISYASQEPWLFTGPVRHNILFGQPMDNRRYKDVVRVCALEHDFELLPHGDKTIVGERGITLSGGQKARINLARAIYKNADIYLLDDPLSAVDAHVGRHLFEDCISSFLQGKTRILVTHQLQYLQTADSIICINNGTVDAKGTFSQLCESKVEFVKQLSIDSEEHEKENESKSGDGDLHLQKRVRQISESSTLSSNSPSEPVVVTEMRSHGKVSSKVYSVYIAAGGNCVFTALVFGLCILAQIAVSAGDYWMSFWSNTEEQRGNYKQFTHKPTKNEFGNDTFVPSENNNSTNLTVTNQFEMDTLLSSTTCIIIYSGFVIAIVVLVVLSIISFISMCMRASVSLHNAMFTNITRATMWFFNSNPSGQILNRFSKDMGSIDDFLPLIAFDCVQIGLALLGIIIVVAIVNFWLMIPTAAMCIILILLRMYYLSTSRSIKRLEGITRSPVFSHLSATLQGLTTIRAFGAQMLLEKEFDIHQDLHSSAWFMFISTSRAFALWLDGACLMYISCVTLSFLFVGGEHYGGDVGLAISQSMALLGMIQWGMRQSAELENTMTSVERVLEYTGVDSEPPLESLPDKRPQENWPSKGVVVFEKVFLSYTKDDPPVLKNVSFSIQSCEKVGIVGRTGAGKSSLISSLFRLFDISEGTIHVDGVDTSTIGLHDLRSKISIIPQEPTLFSGTVRDNLDPFDQYSDAILWSVLAEVKLKSSIDDLPAGLNHKVSEGGSNFSVGQRQLLCLARAILRKNKILVLDEATANVDPQ